MRMAVEHVYAAIMKLSVLQNLGFGILPNVNIVAGWELTALSSSVRTTSANPIWSVSLSEKARIIVA
jgi:hypothetical protein